MNFIEELNELTIKEQTLKNDYEQAEEDLKIKITQLKEENQPLINQKKEAWQKNKQTLNNYYQTIEKYANFNPSTILPILTQIISAFELKEYIYKIINYNQVLYFNGDRKSTLRQKKFIIAEELDQNLTSTLSSLKDYEKTKDYLDLGSYPNTISFYTYNHMYGFQKNFNFQYFPYLDEFINQVINYKIENNIIAITYPQLEKLMLNYLKDNEQKIKANLNASIQEQISGLNQNKSAKLNILTRILKDN